MASFPFSFRHVLGLGFFKKKCFQYYTKINPPDRGHFVPSSACSHQLLHLRYISAPSPPGFHAEPSDGQALIRL